MTGTQPGKQTGHAASIYRMGDADQWIAGRRHVGHFVEVSVHPDRAGVAGIGQPVVHCGRLVAVARMVAGQAGTVVVLQPTAPGSAPVALSLAAVISIRRTA